MNISLKDEFVDKYVQYILKMETLSDITTFDNVFYQLVLFVHDNTQQFNSSHHTHKLKENCLYVNKIFQPDIKFYDHGHETLTYIKYIQEFCPTEISQETIQGNSNIQTLYGCDFRCTHTFNLISDKLKTCGFSKEKLTQQQNELTKLKNDLINDPSKQGEYDEKLIKFKKDLITVKNICLFRKLVQESKSR